MTGEIIFSIIGFLLIVLGFIGCVVPVLPGPLLSFSALLAISIPGGFSIFKPATLIILGTAAVISQLLDNLLPVISSKRAGAGKAGIWGSIIGMLAGIIFFPPAGVIIGAFIGALAGEMLFNQENDRPFKAAFGVFTGTLLGIILKITISGIITAVFIRGIRKML